MAVTSINPDVASNLEILNFFTTKLTDMIKQEPGGFRLVEYDETAKRFNLYANSGNVFVIRLEIVHNEN